MARDAAGGVGGVEEDGLIKPSRKIEWKCRRGYEGFGTLDCPDCATELTRDISPDPARPRPSKKREPKSAADNKILPIDLRVGDRLPDERGEWEVIAPPYSTTEGRVVHARVQRINEPASWEIRSWDAAKRISVARASAEGDKR